VPAPAPSNPAAPVSHLHLPQGPTAHIGKRSVLVPLPAAQVLVSFVHSHAIEPTIKTTPAGKLLDISENMQEHLLRQVGSLVSAHHSNHQPIDLAVEDVVQVPPSAAIAGATTRHNCGQHMVIRLTTYHRCAGSALSSHAVARFFAGIGVGSVGRLFSSLPTDAFAKRTTTSQLVWGRPASCFAVPSTTLT